MKKFRNLTPAPMFEHAVDPFACRRGNHPIRPTAPIAAEPDPLPAGEVVFRWLGHSSVFLRLGGKNILIDPVLSRFTSPVPFIGPRRFPGRCIRGDELPPIDFVLITHNHYDHLDKSTLRMLDGKVGRYFVPAGVDRYLRRFGISAEKIKVLQWYEEAEIGGIKIVCLPTRHGSARGLLDGNRSLWCAYLLKADGFTVLDTGDGGYGNHFRDFRSRYGDVDLAIMECGQYSVRWHAMHMFPEESVQAALDVGAKLAIPVHWGGYVLSDHPWDDPPLRFAERAGELGLNCRIATINKAIVIKDSPSPLR